MLMIISLHFSVDLNEFNLFLLKVGELLTKDSVSPNLQNDDGLSALHQVFFLSFRQTNYCSHSTVSDIFFSLYNIKL